VILLDFPLKRPRSLVGQKVDSTPSTTVSATSNMPIPFGALVTFDDQEMCKIPTVKEDLKKPLGITLRQFYSLRYEPKTAIAALRQGRIWVEGEDVSDTQKIAPFDPVFIKLVDGKAIFTVMAEGHVELSGAIFLEALSDGKVPIEINLLGGR
jgi:hypothetical protein